VSIVIDQNTRTPASPAFASLTRSAANDDHLPRSMGAEIATPDTTGGWDAYDVWRKLIKEARDRREGLSGESLK